MNLCHKKGESLVLKRVVALNYQVFCGFTFYTILDSQVTSLIHFHRSLSVFCHDLIFTTPRLPQSSLPRSYIDINSIAPTIFFVKTHHITSNLTSTAMASSTQQSEVCIPCGQQFNDWKDYIRHLITSGNHPHACGTCGQEFRSEEGKQSHQRQVCSSPNSSITILTASGPSSGSRAQMYWMPQGIHSMRKFGPAR